MSATAVLGLLGPLSLVILLLVVGLLSKRLGEQTHAKPYYLGFYVAALLVLISAAARILDNALDVPADDLRWIIVEDGLPALALTIGILIAWRYWSWLLAERD